MKMSEILEALSPATYVAIAEVGIAVDGQHWEFEKALVYPPISIGEWSIGSQSEWRGEDMPTKEELKDREIAAMICLYAGGHPYIDIQIWSKEEKEG